MKAVVLAGGLGRRLQPFTMILPKPLMPLGDKPVLENVLGYLKGHGIEDVTICIGHLGQFIRTFFGDGSKLGLRITYSEEETARGTAGPLDLIRDELKETFLVMNGDIVTDLDLAAFLRFHVEQQCAASVALVQRNVAIDFGVVHVNDEQRITGWDEKPSLQYLVSTGLYLFEPRALHHVPRAGPFDIPDLIRALYQSGERTGGFRHHGHWLDIGRPEDYEQACRELAAGSANPSSP